MCYRRVRLEKWRENDGAGEGERTIYAAKPRGVGPWAFWQPCTGDKRVDVMGPACLYELMCFEATSTSGSGDFRILLAFKCVNKPKAECCASWALKNSAMTQVPCRQGAESLCCWQDSASGR